MLVAQEDGGWVGEERQASRLTSSFLTCLACGGDSDGLRLEWSFDQDWPADFSEGRWFMGFGI